MSGKAILLLNWFMFVRVLLKYELADKLHLVMMLYSFDNEEERH